jgi:hypothetical protein
MTVNKRIVCLANSRKMSGRCLAGKEIVKNKPVGWIRPVSSREHEEISEYERQYEDGSDPRVLDIIHVPLIESRPKQYQKENWLLDSEYYWVKLGRANWKDLQPLIDLPENLWINSTSTYNGLNDRILLSDAQILTSSLRLIQVDSLTLCVRSSGAAFGNPRRQVQARFKYNKVEYWLKVTDPIYERMYLQQPNGIYSIGESLLTISIGEPYEGYCYKLVAAIILREEEDV